MRRRNCVPTGVSDELYSESLQHLDVPSRLGLVIHSTTHRCNHPYIWMQAAARVSAQLRERCALLSHK
jgi:hypothetical protein